MVARSGNPEQADNDCLGNKQHVPARRQGMVNEDFPFVRGVPLRCGKGASRTGATMEFGL